MNIFFDAEMIGTTDPAVIEQITAGVKPPATHKKAETILKWELEDKPLAVIEAIKKTSFDGTYGKIICIGYAFDNGPIEAVYGDERYILIEFFSHIREATKNGRDITMIGHNIVGFDLKFLWKRCIINGIRPPGAIPFKAKPWDVSIFDTMLQWDADPSKRISLDSLCKVLGVPSSKTDMDGSQVWDYYNAGRISEIADYCKKDVEAVRHCYRRMTFNPLVEANP